jgi:predicted O-methyltransferase YrrM
MNDPLASVKCKPELHQLFDELKFTTGVEVGVLRGLGSEAILRQSKIKRLYSIDYWSHEDKSDLSNSEDYLHAALRLFKYEDRSVIINMDANEASTLFGDDSLCFVYIDAGLTYDLYYEHLETWWPKVKPGGVFAGHLFDWVAQDGLYVETDISLRASDFFVEKYGLDKWTIINRPLPPNADPESFRGSRTWFVRKPEVVPSA